MYLTYTSRMMECRQDGYEEGWEEGISIGLKQGLERGIERGAYEKALETAKNLLAMGLAPEQVAQGTNLPIETIQGILP